MGLPSAAQALLACGLAGAALMGAMLPAAADLNTQGGYRSRDLATVADGHRLKANIVRADGAIIVAEDASPYGDSHLHLVRPGQAIGPGNQFGATIEVDALVMDGGQVYGLSTAPDAQYQNACPLYVIDPATGAARLLRHWRHCGSQLAVDPATSDVVLQDGAQPGSQNGPIVELDPATGAVTATLVPSTPSPTVEAIAFSPAGDTVYLGNSQYVAGGGTPTPDAVYAYSRQGVQLYPPILTDASPDGMMFGRSGTCFAGALVFSTDPNNGATGNVYLLPRPGLGAQPQLIASAPNPDLGLLWMSTTASADPVVSHNGQVTEVLCPATAPPPPPAPAPPQPAPPAQPAAQAQAPRPPQTGNAAAAEPGSRGATLLTPPGPPAPAVQAATVQAAQPAAQGALQAAPGAGLVDAPEDEHAFSVAASAIPQLPGAAWVRLALGSMAVGGMALAALWLVPDPAGRPGLQRAWTRR